MGLVSNLALFLSGINGGCSPKQYQVNFYSGNGSFGTGQYELLDLPGDVLSWKRFLVHENSFRDVAFATLVGNFNESGTVTIKLVSRWLGNDTVDLALPTSGGDTPRVSPTLVVTDTGG
ncbi:hypothetical protein CPB97_010413 [Podila verticillata]|nr:hypothetical protein CPB97_010413 [Podila verticillata]